MASKIHVATVLKEYLIDVAEATRNDPDLLLGASPRATLFIQRAARTHAAARGRDYVSPDDVKIMRPAPVARTASITLRVPTTFTSKS